MSDYVNMFGSGQVGLEPDDSDVSSTPADEAAGRLPNRFEAQQVSSISYIYAIGRITPQYPELAIEKEISQVIGRRQSNGLNDNQVLYQALTAAENRYLVRQLRWVMSIAGLATYIVVPRDFSDLDLFVATLRPRPGPRDLDVVIGVKGPIAPPTVCNGMTLPIVVADQIYSFDADDLLAAIPVPDGIAADEFKGTTEEVFARVGQLADNSGNADGHRALNYLAIRYPTIYTKTVECHSAGKSLSDVTVVPSRLAGIRQVLDVVFTFVTRSTGVADKYFVRVDVTEQFPFIVSSLAPYYDR
jgi:hypothetical protein